MIDVECPWCGIELAGYQCYFREIFPISAAMVIFLQYPMDYPENYEAMMILTKSSDPHFGKA